MELLPCPFCGTKPEVIEFGNDSTRQRSVSIKCQKCRVGRTDAGLRSSMEILRNFAAKQWNTRT